MIKLSFQDVNEGVAKFREAYAHNKPKPIYFYKYIKRVLQERWAVEEHEFPMTVKIPKSYEYLIKGDFEPAEVITIEKPIMMDLGDGEPVPMWFSSTADQAFMRLGYKNLDARYISDLRMDMQYIHGFLGGSTGHGKSVTLNSLIGGLCFEYAPWELELHLSDAKIVEFKKYGIGAHIPHISTIAATEDADFVISVLQKAFNEMNLRGKFFANVGASNLKSFRKKTGLALPRVVIIMDEVESTFKLAGNKAKKISDLIDGFTRLGRAAGYHIIMATQNMSSDIPSSAVGQIRIRMCLGANEKTSEAVLGNKGATENVGKIGRLIVNTEAMAGGNTLPFNVKFQTPFLTDDNFVEEMKFLEAKGEEAGFKRVMSFYDEEDIYTLAQYDEVLDRVFVNMQGRGDLDGQSIICLGMPAFVTQDVDQLLKVFLDGRDIENIIISSSVEDRVAAYLHIISKSLGHTHSILHYYTNKSLTDYIPNAPGGEAREVVSPTLQGAFNLVRKRLYLLYLDSLIAGATFDRAKVEKIMREDKVPKSAFGNDMFYKRVTAFVATQHGAEHKSMWEPVKGMFPSSLTLFQEYSKYNAMIEPLTVQKFSKVCIFVGQISNIIGYGRSPKSSYLNEFKKVLQDACRVGVVFVLYTRSMEGVTDLNSAVRYVILDSPDKKEWGRFRLDEPRGQSNVLACLYDSIDSVEPIKKFKRTMLRDELGG